MLNEMQVDVKLLQESNQKGIVI